MPETAETPAAEIGSTETPAAEASSAEVPSAPVRVARRRAPKLDALLAEAVDRAREALADLAAEGQVGEHRGAVADDDRLVTHRFAAELPGYRGWEWYATLARAPRSRQLTVCETGLMPGSDAILAPDWVPWSERVNAEEKARLEAIANGQDPDQVLREMRQHDAEQQAAEAEDAAAAADADADDAADVDGSPDSDDND